MTADWSRFSRRTRTGLVKRCPSCGIPLELALEPLAGGEAYRWVFPVHALFSSRCAGSLAEYDPWEGARATPLDP